VRRTAQKLPANARFPIPTVEDAWLKPGLEVLLVREDESKPEAHEPVAKAPAIIALISASGDGCVAVDYLHPAQRLQVALEVGGAAAERRRQFGQRLLTGRELLEERVVDPGRAQLLLQYLARVIE
jgi:hypothetical protein